MRSIFLITILFSVIFSSCKSQQYSIDNLPEKQVVFGNGGGITGAADMYTLLDNGQLFHTNSFTQETKELEPVKKKEAKACFVQMDSLSIAEMDFNHPGNLYYFLQKVDGDIKEKITWGSLDYEAPEQCKELYNELTALLK